MNKALLKDEILKEIKNHNNIVFFGGAGVSCASGIPDFRGARGLYNEAPEEIVSHHYFIERPEEFYKFYFSKMVYPNALPNECHKALAYLEKIGKLSAIVTQNIDGLHQMAGSKNVYELHGTIHKNHCTKCSKFYSLDELDMTGVPRCSCGGIIKPDVVLYEEGLDEKVIMESIKAISNADLLIIAGTSLVVYPAAGFVRYYRGKRTITINLGSADFINDENITLNEKVEEILNIKNLKEYGIE